MLITAIETRISYSVSAQTGDLRTRNSLVVAVSSQQRGCQARRRCDTREMTSGITVGGAYVDLQAAVSAQYNSRSDDGDLLEANDARETVNDSERRGA